MLRALSLILILISSLLVLAQGCGLIGKTYEITVVNDTFLDGITIYLDGEREFGLGKPLTSPSQWYGGFRLGTAYVNYIDKKTIKGVGEGSHVLEIKQEGTTISEWPFHVNQDMKIYISDLTDEWSILPEKE